MLSHRGQFCTRRVTLGGVIMLSFMLLFNLSTSLAQWCDGNVEQVKLIGLTADHLVVITGESEGDCSYYLPTDSLDTENMQIHLNGGLLLSERWPKFYEKFDGNLYARFTVRDATGRNIIVVDHDAYDIDLDKLYKLPFQLSIPVNSSISSTKNMTYFAIFTMVSEYIVRFTSSVTRNLRNTPYGIFEFTMLSSVMYEAQYEDIERISYMCSDFENENIYLHKAPNDTGNGLKDAVNHCLDCELDLTWTLLGRSGFTDGTRFYLFSSNLVYILNTPELVVQKRPSTKSCVCNTLVNVTSKEVSAFFTKPPPPPLKFQPLVHDPNGNPAKSGSSSSNTGLIILVFVLFIIFCFCIVGCCLWFFRKEKKKPKNADKNTKTDAGRVETQMKSSSESESDESASSSKRATSVAVASKKTGKQSSMRNDNLATSRRASSRRPSSRKNLSSKRATSLSVDSKKTGKPSSMPNDNLATCRRASSRRASSRQSLSSPRVNSPTNKPSKEDLKRIVLVKHPYSKDDLTLENMSNISMVVAPPSQPQKDEDHKQTDKDKEIKDKEEKDNNSTAESMLDIKKEKK